MEQRPVRTRRWQGDSDQSASSGRGEGSGVGVRAHGAMTAGAMVEAYVAGPMVGDVAAVLVCRRTFPCAEPCDAFPCAGRIDVCAVGPVVRDDAHASRNRTCRRRVAVRVLRLVVLPVVIYVILPFALYTGGVVERMLAVCATDAGILYDGVRRGRSGIVAGTSVGGAAACLDDCAVGRGSVGRQRVAGFDAYGAGLCDRCHGR